MTTKIAVFPGDGIGPEVTAEAVACLKVVDEKAGLGFEFEEVLIGGCAIDETGSALPDSSLRVAAEADAALLGAVSRGTAGGVSAWPPRRGTTRRRRPRPGRAR